MTDGGKNTHSSAGGASISYDRVDPSLYSPLTEEGLEDELAMMLYGLCYSLGSGKWAVERGSGIKFTEWRFERVRTAPAKTKQILLYTYTSSASSNDRQA